MVDCKRRACLFEGGRDALQETVRWRQKKQYIPSYSVRQAIKGIRLAADGKISEGWEILKDLTGDDLLKASKICEEQCRTADRIMKIGKQHGFVTESNKDTIKLGYVLEHAAHAGNKQAKKMIDAGVLEQTVY